MDQTELKTKSMFVISNWTSSWTNAAQAGCVLATPNISYDGNNYQVDSTDIPADIHEPVWIGYYKMPRGFEYVGCIETQYLVQKGRKLNTNVSKPSDCLPGCENDNYVGVTIDTNTGKHNCHCLADYNDSKISGGCTSECPGMDGVACGSTDRVSVYRFLSRGIASNHTIEDKCLAIKHRQEDWIDCNTSLTYMLCEDENNVRSGEDKTGVKWLDVVENCLRSSSRPSSYNLSISFDKNNHQSWTGVFKSGVIYTHDGWKPFTSGEQYGYIDNSNGTLKFDNDSPRKMLCKTVTPRTSTLRFEDTEVFHTQSTQPSNKLNIKQGDESSANIIVPVVITVSVIVFLIVVITLMILCIKRKRKPKSASQTKVISNNKQYVASYSCPQVHGAAEHLLDEKGPSDASILQFYDDQKTATYDTTTAHERSKDVGKTINIKEHEDVNVYNKLGEQEREETYDQTTIWNNTANVLNSNNVYDSNDISFSEYACANAAIGLLSYVEKTPDHVYNKSEPREGVSNF